MTHTKVDFLNLNRSSYMRYIGTFLSLCIVLGLLTWSIYQYQPNPNFYGPRAIYSMLILSVALALLGRIILIRMMKFEIAQAGIHPYQLRSAWRFLFLIDITAPLYLAAGVLIGPPAAVLLALITQTALQGFTLSQRFVSWPEACYHIVGISLIALVSSLVYRLIGGPPQIHFVDHFQPIASLERIFALFNTTFPGTDSKCGTSLACCRYL